MNISLFYRVGSARAVAARAGAAPHVAAGGSGSPSVMRKPIRVESPLVITGITKSFHYPVFGFGGRHG